MIKVKLKQILDERGISGKQLSEDLKIRPNAISEMINNQRTTINREQISKIMKYLDIKDFNELFVMDED